MNSVNIIGRIGKEIEFKYLQSGTPVASFSIAVDQSYKDKNSGQKVEKTSWLDIKTIGGVSETINQYFNKGSMIGITGELEQETWNTQDGTSRSRVVIKLKDFTFIDKKSNAGMPQQASQQSYAQPQQQAYQPPQPQYENAQGRPTPPPKRQAVPHQPSSIDIDEESLPF